MTQNKGPTIEWDRGRGEEEVARPRRAEEGRIAVEKMVEWLGHLMANSIVIGLVPIV
jgi:hypothetical protein